MRNSRTITTATYFSHEDTFVLPVLGKKKLMSTLIVQLKSNMYIQGIAF